MAFIETECGTCNSDGLLTVRKFNGAYRGWQILLKYKSRKDDLEFNCKDENEADECLTKINETLKNLSSFLI